MTTYQICLLMVQRGIDNKEDFMNKLDLFLLANRITKDQYEELVAMLAPDAAEKL